MLSTIQNALHNRRGQSLVEYGILIGAIALVCLAGTAILGHKINDLIGASAALLPGAHDEDNAPVFSGRLVQTTQGADGAVHLNSVPGTFSTNLGITGAEGLITE